MMTHTATVLVWSFADTLGVAVPVVLLVHLTWTTYRRMPMIGPSEESFLKRFIPAESLRHGAEVIALGIVRDHVHVVLRLPARFDLPRLVQGLKGASARLANQDEAISKTGLRWDAGYNTASVGRRQLPVVVEYVKKQSRRHPDLRIDSALQGASRSAEPGL